MPSLLLAFLLSVVTVLLLVRTSGVLRQELAGFPSPVRSGFALFLLAATLALASFAPLLQYSAVDPNQVPENIPFGFYFAGHGLLVAFLVSWWGLAGCPSLAKFLVFRWRPLWSAVRFGLIGGFVAWLVTLSVMAIVAGLTTLLDPTALPQQEGLPATVGRIVELSWFQRLLLVLSAGIVEEAFFRSFLQTRTGLLISTLFFVVSHMTYGLPLMLVGIFAVSLMFGLIFRARNDVVPCMVAHSTFDAIQLFLILPATAAAS